ncbi:MAG: type 2 isopentenyl-diphosphate Delta-isomerase [Actinomycetota bacterium]
MTAGEHASRKRDHLALALGGDVGFATTTTGLERWRLRARALPEADLDDVDLSGSLWGRPVAAPLLLSCMTGGTGEAGPVNRALGTAAQHHGLAVGLGSGRVLLADPQRREGFDVRAVAPDVPLLANLGAVQLAEVGVDGCAALVEACAADALVLHLNAVQEALQVGGDTAFGGLAERIAETAAALSVPVVVKEVGFGLAPEDVDLLLDAGVAGIDVAGAGGTNWARLEGRRDAWAGAVAAAFADWGWPTAAAVAHARAALDRRGEVDVVLIASGGITDGVDVAKALCLGADLAGVARGVLAAAAEGPQAAIDAVGVVLEQLRVAAWAAGATRPADLDASRLEAVGPPEAR